jgi:hypothetical protein
MFEVIGNLAEVARLGLRGRLRPSPRRGTSDIQRSRQGESSAVIYRSVDK